MNFYIERNKDGDVVAKGVTTDEAIIESPLIEVTKEEFDSIEQFKPPIRDNIIPSIEERLVIAEDTINYLLGL